MNQHEEILNHTPLREVFSLRFYIQHLMDESQDETQNPLIEENWMKQNNWKFIKYVIYHRHSMTLEQLKQNPLEAIFNIKHDKVDTEERVSIEEEEKSTTSPEKLEQDSESDKATEDKEEPNTTETHQVHNVLNETTHDEEKVSETEDDTSQEENSSEAESDTSEDDCAAEIQTYENNGEQNKEEDKLLTTNFEVKVNNRIVEGLITYSTDQQIFQYKSIL